MAADKHQRTGPHDLGGEDSGPIPLASNDPAWWEKRIDAVFKLLGDEKRQILRVDELRRGIETLGDDAYARLSYYERSTVAIANLLLEKNVIGVDELQRKMDEVAARAANVHD